MEESKNSTLLSTSDVGVVVKRSNPIRISGAEVKAALGLILAERSIDELTTPFVREVGHGTPSGAWNLLRASDRIIRHRPRMYLLQEVTVNRGDIIRGLSLHKYTSQPTLQRLELEAFSS